MASAALPPLPPLPDSNSSGPQVSAAPTPGNSGLSQTPFGGGLPTIMAATKQVETGLQALVTVLPSIGDLASDIISKLRMAIPNAMSAGAAQGPPSPGPQGPGGPGQLPPSPQGAQ